MNEPYSRFHAYCWTVVLIWSVIGLPILDSYSNIIHGIVLSASMGHFKEMWRRVFEEFLGSAQPGDFICVAPELLPSGVYYARTFIQENQEVEEGDRWAQAEFLLRSAKLSWEEAIGKLKSLNE